MSPLKRKEAFPAQENTSNQTWCFIRVDESKKCRICLTHLVKNGKTNAGEQRYFCKNCRLSRVLVASENGYGEKFNSQIARFTMEGLGIRSTARILNISPATVIRKILRLAASIKPPPIPNSSVRFQVDELHTYIGNKKREICVIFSWNKELRQAMTLSVGTRSKSNLRSVIAPLLESGAENINTDRYSGYIGVIPRKVHTTYKRRNNHIERQNLNLRIHLKRLSRRTICFSRSAAMLLAVVKIYFWG